MKITYQQELELLDKLREMNFTDCAIFSALWKIENDIGIGQAMSETILEINKEEEKDVTHDPK
jgi:hypothetical protein